MPKRLYIKASSDYTGPFQTVPVNSLAPVRIDSDIGTFELLINIKNFDGSEHHKSNSLYNVGDKKLLDGTPVPQPQEAPAKVSNLCFELNYKPRFPIRGNELVFGNDFTTPIKDYVPTRLLTAGLKFFNWFINSTVKGDIYCDKPYLYGPVLNSCTYISIDEPIPFAHSTTDSSTDKLRENLDDNVDNVLQVPKMSHERKRFFNKLANCEGFTFVDSAVYKLKFDTNFIKMSDSRYSVSLPTYNSNTFDIDVLRYANDHLDNFNWVIKVGGLDGVGAGQIGLVVNFSLEQE